MSDARVRIGFASLTSTFSVDITFFGELAKILSIRARIAASGYSLPETIAMKVAGSIFAVSGTRCR
jgi:hypothetical protein